MRFPEHVDTDRLVLRRWRAADREAFQRIWADPDVWRALRPNSPFDPAHGAARFEHHVRHWEQHGFGLWSARERGGGQIAGWVGLAHPTFIPQLAGAVEVGWTLRRELRGRGLAGEGAAAAVAAGFAHLDVDDLIALIDAGNERSIAVAGRLGMRHGSSVAHPELGDTLEVHVLSRDRAS